MPERRALGLASRGLRLAAAMVDGVLSLFVSLPLVFYTGYLEKALAGTVDYVTGYAISLVGLAMFAAMHGYLLVKHGQTIGKRWVGTRIVNVSDGRVPTIRALLVRYATMKLVAYIPLVGGLFALVNILFIFRRDRRCLHDLAAGTKVVIMPFSR
ncbi:MAG TPA: RDD family protein [Gammaproteobacteria bacterium]